MLLIRKVFGFLQNSPMTAKDFSTHLGGIKKVEDVEEEHTREKMTFLDF